MSNQVSDAIAGSAFPCNNDAEMAVLSCLIQGETGGELFDLLSEDHFYDAKNSIIWRVIRDWKVRGGKMDYVSLCMAIEQSEHSEGAKTGFRERMCDLLTLIPSPAQWRFYYEQAEAFRYRRSVIQSALSAVGAARDLSMEIDGVQAAVDESYTGAKYNTEEREANTCTDSALSAIDSIESMLGKKDETMGLATGLLDLDRLTDGMHGGEMIILAARPSCGKTALGMQIAYETAVKQNIPTLVFTAEMQESQLMKRLIMGASNVSVGDVKWGRVNQKQMQDMVEVASSLAKAPLYLQDKSSPAIAWLKAVATRTHRKHGIKLIVVDYLQLLKASSKRGKDDRRLEVSECSATLKALAKDLDIPLLVLAQLNRDSTKRKGGKPVLSDLKESGDIEQDADQVWLLHRPEQHALDEDSRSELEGQAELDVAKNRNGPTGIVKLTFQKERTMFVPAPKIFERN